MLLQVYLKIGRRTLLDNRNREAETLGSTGPFVKVTWNDAASTFKEYSWDVVGKRWINFINKIKEEIKK